MSYTKNIHVGLLSHSPMQMTLLSIYSSDFKKYEKYANSQNQIIRKYNRYFRDEDLTFLESWRKYTHDFSSSQTKTKSNKWKHKSLADIYAILSYTDSRLPALLSLLARPFSRIFMFTRFLYLNFCRISHVAVGRLYLPEIENNTRTYI